MLLLESWLLPLWVTFLTFEYKTNLKYGQRIYKHFCLWISTAGRQTSISAVTTSVQQSTLYLALEKYAVVFVDLWCKYIKVLCWHGRKVWNKLRVYENTKNTTFPPLHNYGVNIICPPEIWTQDLLAFFSFDWLSCSSIDLGLGE